MARPLPPDADSRERRRCGTIDGMWQDGLESTLVHPGPLSPGTLRIGVVLYAVSEPGVVGDRAPEPQVEAWVEIPVMESPRVMARSGLARGQTGADPSPKRAFRHPSGYS